MLLTITDAVLVVVFLVLTVGFGLVYGQEKESKKGKNDNEVEEYILAGNKIGYLATGMSLSASFLSAFGMIGLPTQAMLSGTVIFTSQVAVTILVVGLIHFYILPMLKRHNLPSIYAIIKYKYGEKCLKLALILGLPVRFIVGGIQMYNPALAVETVTGIDLVTIIIATNVLVLFYTFVGGYRAVITTDIIQVSIMLFGILAASIFIWQGSYLKVGWHEIWNFAEAKQRLMHLGRLTTLSPYQRETTLWLFGSMFIGMFNRFGCAQDMVQRMIAVKGGREGATKSLIVMLFINTITNAQNFIVAGLAAFYLVKGCDWSKTEGDSIAKDQIVPLMVSRLFKLAHSDYFGLPFIGLYTAALYSASLSTISSLLNSMAMQVIADVLPAIGVQLTTTKQKLTWSKIAVCLSSAIVTLASLFVAMLGKYGYNSYIVMLLFAAPAAPINAVTLMATMPFFGKTGKRSMYIGIMAGLVFSLAVIIFGFFIDKMPWSHVPEVRNTLPLISGCSLQLNSSQITDMFQLPGYCRNASETCLTVADSMAAVRGNASLDWSGPLTWPRNLYWVSNFARIIEVIFVTVLATKIANWYLGEKNDPIGEVPVLERLL